MKIVCDGFEVMVKFFVGGELNFDFNKRDLSEEERESFCLREKIDRERGLLE